MPRFLNLTALLLLCVLSFSANAEDDRAPNASVSGVTGGSAGEASQLDQADQAEEADVENIKKRYWTRGNRSEIGVVQDRALSESNHFELSAGAGSLLGDPFLSTYTVGGSLGFHFSESFSVHVTGWKALVSPSSASNTYQSSVGSAPATNQMLYFVGAEARYGFLYGKLNFVDSMIVHFDVFGSAGGGALGTVSGTGALIDVGIGGQLHLSKTFSVNLEDRVLGYQDSVPSKNTVTASNMITLGISCFIGIL